MSNVVKKPPEARERHETDSPSSLPEVTNPTNTLISDI
jgi:hypothetical protein